MAPPPAQPTVPLQEEFTGSNPATLSSQDWGRSLVPISALLCNSPSPAVPPQPRYTIRMRQQPEAARACGFGDKDRRAIDPPPILQMDVDIPNTTAKERIALIQQLDPIVDCTLWDPVNDREDTMMPGPTNKKPARKLIGTPVAYKAVGKDENKIDGCFFCFPDLSVRVQGNYRLRFRLITISGPGHPAPVWLTTMSSPFDVYSAKEFRGMKASTELTKTLKSQGFLIPIKKGNANSEREHDQDNDDEDEEESKGKKPSKRSKGKKPSKRSKLR